MAKLDLSKLFLNPAMGSSMIGGVGSNPFYNPTPITQIQTGQSSLPPPTPKKIDLAGGRISPMILSPDAPQVPTIGAPPAPPGLPGTPESSAQLGESAATKALYQEGGEETVPEKETSSQKTLREARDVERRKIRASQGRKSTILTGPQGVQEEATIRRKTLLGY